MLRVQSTTSAARRTQLTVNQPDMRESLFRLRSRWGSIQMPAARYACATSHTEVIGLREKRLTADRENEPVR